MNRTGTSNIGAVYSVVSMKIRASKISGILFGAIVLVLIIIAVAAPLILDLNRYHGLIVSEVEKAVGGTVKLGRISWGITHRVWLAVDGFSVVGASAFQGDVKLTRIYASVSIPDLLTKKIIVQKLQVDSSEVRFGLSPAPKNTGPPADDTKYAGVHLPIEIEIRQLALAIKRFEFSNARSIAGQTLVHVFSDVDLAANDIAPATVMAFNLSFRDNSPAGLGTLTAQGTFRGLTKSLTLESPELKLTASLEALQVEAFKPYLNNNPLKNKLSGSISMKATGDVDLTKNNLHAQGEIDLGNLTYTDPASWEAALPGQPTTVAFQINLDPQDLTAEKIAIQLGGLSLEARAVIKGWKEDPVITGAEISADLPLLDVMPLVPWKQLGSNADFIRSILLGGGKVVFNKITFPEVRVAKPPATVNDLLSGIEMAGQVTGISIKPSPNAPKMESISGVVTLKNNVLVAENIHSRLGPIALPTVSIHVSEIAAQPKGTIRVNGPLQVAGTGEAHIEKLLMQHGLKALTGSADIDVRADFDQRRPNDWTVNGSMVLKGVRAETHPEKILMNNLNGAVHFNRDKVISIAAQDLSAQINQAPVKLSGRLINVGEPDMLIETKVHAKQLNLSHLAAFIPSLKAMKPSGNVDLDVEVHIPFATPAESRLTGTLATRNVGLHLAATGLSVEDGNIQMVLAGNSATVKAMTLRINDQQLAVSGKLSNPLKPNAKILITSPDLDLDRLLPQNEDKNPLPKGPKAQAEKPAMKVESTKRKLPPLARKLTADLQIKAEQGHYRGLSFKKLNLNLQYNRGVIEHYALDFGVDQGRVNTKGTADLRDLDRIPFSVDPKLTALHLETIAPVLGMEKPPFTGPLSLTGKLQGRTGSRQELLTSLFGNMKIEMGPGRVTNAGITGDLILKIFSMTSIRGLLSGSIVDDLRDQGVSFRTIKTQNTIKKGILAVNGFEFISDEMMMNADGDINLIDEDLDLVIKLNLLRSVGKAIGSIPLIGKTAEDLTEIYIGIKGPYEKPEIRPATTKEIDEAFKSVVKAPETVIKKVEKGFMKIF